MPDFIAFNLNMALVILILLAATVLFLSGKFRVDVVAILVLVMLGISRLLPADELFSGFSSEAVLSLISIMVLSAGLERCGITQMIATWILRWSKEHHNKVLAYLMLMSGMMASFLRSLGTVAIFMPVVNRISTRTKISKEQLLMPLAFCALIGGTLTMVGTGPLILLNSLLAHAAIHSDDVAKLKLEPFNLFDVFPIGLLLLITGAIYLAFASKKLLSLKAVKSVSTGTQKAQFAKIYGKGGDIFELKVLPSCEFIDASLKTVELKLPSALTIIAIKDSNETYFPPLRKTIIKPNSYLAIMGGADEVEEFAKENNLKLFPKLDVFSEIINPSRAGLCEIVIPPSSELIGKEVKDLHIKRNYAMQALALYRGDTVYQGEELKNLTLRSGDTLGLYSQWEALAKFKDSSDFVVITTKFPTSKVSTHKIPHALTFFSLGIFLVMYFNFSISLGLLVGAIGMIGSGVLSVDDAYEAISWRTIFLLAGLIPLGVAMHTSGIVDWASQYVMKLSEIYPEWVIQIGFAFLATGMALVITNIGATVVLVPLALEVAANIGAEPRIFALTVALAATNTFLIPTHQVNALVAGPGSYSTSDFVKVGGFMTLLFWVVMFIGLRLLF